jgi:hypothetical protein
VGNARFAEEAIEAIAFGRRQGNDSSIPTLVYELQIQRFTIAYLLIANSEKNIAKASITARVVALQSLRFAGAGRGVSSPSSSRGRVS